MTKKALHLVSWLARIGVTLLFLLSLFAIDFNSPHDILSWTTLHRLTHPHLLYQVVTANFHKVGALLSNTRPEMVAMALLTHLICIGLLTYRWQLLLATQNMRFGFFRLYSYYLMGFFFNNFLPTNIGGDVARIYQTGKAYGKITESVSTVFMERFIGFIAVFILSLWAFLAYRQLLQSHTAYYSVVAFAVAIAVVFWILFDPRIRRTIKVVFSKMRLGKFNTTLNEFYQSVLLFKGKKKVLVLVGVFSFAYQFILVFVNLFAAYSIGSYPPMLPVFFIIQISTLICLIPLSINGIGIREYLYVQFLGLSGIAADQTLAFQIILFGISYLESIAGGILFLVQKKSKGENATGIENR